MTIKIEPDDTYHDDPAVSRSGLWTIHRKTPAHFRYGEREETKAMKDGKLFHIAVLQPDLLGVRYAIGPDVNKNTNVWKEFVARAAAEGREVISVERYNEVCRMADAAHQESVVQELIDGGRIEMSYYWRDQEFGVDVKARPDIYNPKLKLIGDPKTTVSAQPRDFASSVAKFGYHLQNSVYQTGVVENGLEVDGFVFIAIEKEPPYAVAVYELEPEDVREGWAVYRRSLRQYAGCLKADKWPGYESGVQRLTMPSWGFTEIGNEE